jgi:hypothetical protein
LAGGIVLDPAPLRGPSRKRQTPERLAELERAVRAGERSDVDAALVESRGIRVDARGARLADDVRERLRSIAMDSVAASHEAHPERSGLALAELRVALGTALRRAVTSSAVDAAAAAEAIIESLVADEDLVREGDSVSLPGHQAPAPDPEMDRAGARLVGLLDVSGPPSLSVAAAEAGCTAAVVRELEREGRIIVVDDDLAWSREAYEALTETALTLARVAPMTPAALRDATGTSRKYVMALLEDLARRGILSRTPAGHVPGPRA